MRLMLHIDKVGYYCS